MTVNDEDDDDDDDYEDEEELEESEEEEEEEDDDDDSNSLEEVESAGEDTTTVNKAAELMKEFAGLIDTPEAKKTVSSVSPLKQKSAGTNEEDKDGSAADKDNDDS